MIDYSSCYYELNSISTISTELLNYCNSIDTWARPGYATFLQVTVPKYIYEKDPLIKILCEQGWKEPALFKSEPRSIYKFHSDSGSRPVSLNMQLGAPDSDTLFMGNLLFRSQYELIKVDYKPNRYYLLNTSRQHAVMNYGIDRYVLSLSPPDKYVNINYMKSFSLIVDEFKKQKV